MTSKPKDAAATESDIDALASAHPAIGNTQITLGGKPFTVRPMKVRQVFPVLKLARPMLAALTQRPSSPTPGLPPAAAGPGQGGSTPAPNSIDSIVNPETAAALNDADWILGVLEVHGQDIIKGLAIGIDAEQADIEELEVVDLITLVKHFIVVNASFFEARGLALSPHLSASLGAVAGSQEGQPSS